VRAVRDGALVAIAALRPGEEASLPEGGRVGLRALRYTARLVATRDLSVWPAYAGFVLALAGAFLMFAVVKVDAAVVVVPDGDRERVTVALRPQRFTPIYRAELERLVREEGGPPPPLGGTPT
jgi:hypothetical protein